MSNTLIQILGFFGLFFVVASFQLNDRKKILFSQLFASFFFTIHFFLLGAFSGAVMNFVICFRNCIFYNREKKWGNSILWLYLFLSLIIILGISVWDNIFSLYPILGAAIGTIGLWVRKPSRIRQIMIFASPCWFIYNYSSNSIPGMITEVFVCISIITAIIRFDVLKLSEKKELPSQSI